MSVTEGCGERVQDFTVVDGDCRSWFVQEWSAVVLTSHQHFLWGLAVALDVGMRDLFLMDACAHHRSISEAFLRLSLLLLVAPSRRSDPLSGRPSASSKDTARGANALALRLPVLTAPCDRVKRRFLLPLLLLCSL